LQKVALHESKTYTVLCLVGRLTYKYTINSDSVTKTLSFLFSCLYYDLFYKIYRKVINTFLICTCYKISRNIFKVPWISLN